MIIDTLRNAARYYSVHPLFARAFEYIAGLDLAEMAPGTYEMNGGLKAIVSDKEGKTRDQALEKFECHQQHIDIQLCISGNEEIGWKPIETCVIDKGGFDAARDVQFFGDQPDTYVSLNSGQFVILFPEDVHAPMIGQASIKKMVIKVPVS